MKTFVVYHCFLVKNWKSLVLEQLSRINNSGLLAKVDKLYCVVVDLHNNRDEFIEATKFFPNIEYEFYNQNAYELYAITKVWELGQQHDCKILYLHTKGVYNDYVKVDKNEVCDLKVSSIRDWRLMLEHFCIDKWEENLNRLELVDMVGCSCNSNWWWGNFWWARSSYLKTLEKPANSTRWGYEAWVNERGLASKFEHHHLNFIPYFTDYPEVFYKDGQHLKYKDQKLIVHSAKYGNNGVQLDEGWEEAEPTFKDVMDIVSKNLDENGHKFISLSVINETMGGDPIFKRRKGLFIRYSFENEPEKIYNLHCAEGNRLLFPWFNVA